MTEENKKRQTESVKEIVGKLSDLVKYTIECEKKETKPSMPFQEASKELAKVRKLLDDLDTSFKNTLTTMGLTENDVETFRKKVQESSGPEKQLMLAIQNLIKVCEEARDRLYKSLQENREALQQIQQQGKDDKKKQKERKSKFKSVGGRKGWMPT